MTSSDDYYIDMFNKIPMCLHQYLATTLYVSSNIGNLLSILIFLKKSWKKNVCVFYFIVCLFSNTIFTNSTLLGSIFTLGFNINLHNSSVLLCKLFYYVSYCFSAYYPIFLICASIDRLLISSQHVDTRLYNSKRLAYLSLLTSFFVWTVFSLHILIKVDIQQFGPSIFICSYEHSTAYLSFLLYSTLILNILMSLLLVILSILAFKNVRRIQLIPRQQRQQLRTMNKKDFQLLRCLYVHNIVYIMCNILLVVSIGYNTTLNMETQTPIQQALGVFLSNVGAFIHYIPYCTNFVVFVCISKAFRLELKRFGYKICNKDLRPIREEENHQQEPARDNIGLNNVLVNTIAVSH